MLDLLPPPAVQTQASPEERPRLRMWWWVAFIPVAIVVGAVGGLLIRSHHAELSQPQITSALAAAAPSLSKQIASLPNPARPIAKEPPVPVAPPPVSKPMAARVPAKPATVEAVPVAPTVAKPSSVTPAPATLALSADTTKWLASMDAQWRVSYQRDVGGPFEKGMIELRRQHFVALGNPLAAAKKAGKEDEVVALTAERDQVSKGSNPPATDEASTPVAVKLLRVNFRSQFTRLDKERFERARALFAKCDELLAKTQAALAQRQLSDDAANVQKERDQLRQDWLLPPALMATSLPPALRPAATPAKMTSQQIVTKLVEVNASVYAKRGKAEAVEIKSGTEVGSDEKLTFTRVEFRPKKQDETPLVAADYAILDSLTEVPDLVLSGTAVKDSVMEKLRPFHALRNLTLNGAKPSPAGYNVLPTLPELHDLQMYDTDTKDEAMKTVFQCRKLQRLHLANISLTDAAFTDIAKLTTLEELGLSSLDKLGSPAFAHFAECRSLKRVYLNGFLVLSGMIENLGKCKDLESLTMPGTGLKDADVAPLGGLMKLKTLDLNNSAVTGAVFAAWQQHHQLISLNLSNAAGVEDSICKQIEHTFPKLEQLTVKIAASGFSSEGVAALARIRTLRSVRFEGDGINDDCVAELARCDTITALSIPNAQLSEAGVASLARLPHLADLTLDMPPITDPALKSFTRCKELKMVHIGKDALPDTEVKFLRNVPGVTVIRQE